jgi:exodeoxyribonuclease VIII
MSFQVLDLPPHEYHASEGISSHDLGMIHHSLAYYKHSKSQIHKPKSHYAIGTLLHTAVLEPEKFEGSYSIAPDCEKRSNADKEIWRMSEELAALENKVLVKQADLEEILRIRDSVFAHRSASEAISCGGIFEPSMYATDPETGILLRARPDLVSNGNAIIDLKTTVFGGASKRSFSKTIARFRYDVQAAFYLDMLTLCQMPRETFVWIAVEKEPPYAVAVYYLDDKSIEAGRSQYRADLATYQEALNSGNWGAYSQDVEMISLPDYRLREAAEMNAAELLEEEVQP